ncbi:hypothetical protein PQI51_01435 [Microbacterium esteraromaticum]|uniref:hypothetical protein n=1 Tax=Microbacterium esteraromaticum TaxID=57043 RepID=UPI0030A4BA05
MSDVFSTVKLDFSSFYKFVASVGLLLLAAAVALPWFALRMATPETPASSASAKAVDVATENRAQQYVFILTAYPWLSLGLGVAGLALLGYGLVAWRERQKKHDEDEDETYRQRRELGQTVTASDEEREDKLSEEAASEIEEAPAGRADNAASPNLPSPYRGPSASYLARREFLKHAEMRIAQLVAAAFEDSHSIEHGVRVSGPQSQILDLVARADDAARWTSFAVEVRVMDMASSALMRLRDTMLAVAIGARDIPEGQVQLQRKGRPPIARSVSICVVIVADREAHEERTRPYSNSFLKTRIFEHTHTINQVLLRKVGVIVVAQSELDSLSEEWIRHGVLQVMQEPERAIQRLGVDDVDVDRATVR